MPGLRDLLHRFRPIGAPGAPSAAGVPVDQRARAEAELEPVFAALAGTDHRCAELRRIGAAFARAHQAEAREQAELMLAAAQRTAPEERARVAAEAERHAQAELDRASAEQSTETAQLRENAESILPTLVHDAIEQLLADIAALNSAADSPSRPERP
jgi:uncharacterized membrane protein YqiK